MYRTALTFLANPYQLWACGGYQEKRAVVKMAFPERLVWDRLGMYRNTQRSVPFNVVLFRILEDFSKNKEMVPKAGLEPARLTPLPPQDSVSTNSTTWA